MIIGKHQKISSKEKTANKMFWGSIAGAIAGTAISILVGWNETSPLIESFGGAKLSEAVDKIMSYFISPLFLGYIVFSLGLMKESDQEKWNKSE